MLSRRHLMTYGISAAAAVAIPTMSTTAIATDFAAAHLEGASARIGVTIIGAAAQRAVDDGVASNITEHLSVGRRTVALTDVAMANQLANLRDSETELWLAAIDRHTFSEFARNNPDPTWSFFARLRDDPDTIVFQRFEDRLAWRGQDFLKAGMLSGHDVVCGISCGSVEDMLSTVSAAYSEEPWLLAEIIRDGRFFYDGEDVTGRMKTLHSSSSIPA